MENDYTKAHFITQREQEEMLHRANTQPELLAALKWAVSFFDDPSRVMDSRELAKARSAITKAEESKPKRITPTGVPFMPER